MKGEEGLTRYYYLILLFIGSMIGLVLADNMLQMFIFWEMVGLCSYALISFWYKKPESIHSRCQSFHHDPHRRHRVACRHRNLILHVWHLQFPWSNQWNPSRSCRRYFEHNTSGSVAFLVLGGAIAKSAQLPLFTWLYSAMEAPTSVQRFVTRCHNGQSRCLPARKIHTNLLNRTRHCNLHFNLSGSQQSPGSAS